MKKINNQEFRFISIIIGILATVMILFPALILKDSETSFTGLEIAFGHEFASLGSWASGEIAFNPIVLLAFILPIAGSAVLMFTYKGYLLSTILFAAATILIFMIPQFTTTSITIVDYVTEIDVEWTYGLGLIFAASLSSLGVLLGLVKIYNKTQ